MKKYSSKLLPILLTLGLITGLGLNSKAVVNGLTDLTNGYKDGFTNHAKAASRIVHVKINRVVDGDTLKVQLHGKQETVRLLLIDTPESVKPGVKPQPYAIEASNFAKVALRAGQTVKLELGVSGHDRDKYGRLLAYIYMKNGKMYNEEVVKRGLARVAYVYKPNTKYLSKLNSAQSYAKSHRLKIWSKKGYVTSSGFNANYAAKKSPSSKKSTTSYSKSKVVTYKNCSALNAHYKGGVAKSSNVKNKGGKTHYKPYVSSSLYNANKKSDRDKDGIACER